jgi:hypothetical protein
VCQATVFTVVGVAELVDAICFEMLCEHTTACANTPLTWPMNAITVNYAVFRSRAALGTSLVQWARTRPAGSVVKTTTGPVDVPTAKQSPRQFHAKLVIWEQQNV